MAKCEICEKTLSHGNKISVCAKCLRSGKVDRA